METLKSMCCLCEKDVEFGVYKSLGVMQQVPTIERCQVWGLQKSWCDATSPHDWNYKL
jgi:hypothetical protein